MLTLVVHVEYAESHGEWLPYPIEHAPERLAARLQLVPRLRIAQQIGQRALTPAMQFTENTFSQ